MDKRTVIVTGGARGIGRAMCVEFAKEGANIVINYSRDIESAEVTKNLCEELGAKTILISCDVSKYLDAEKLFAKCEEAFGAPHVLINNAGITRDNLLLRMSEEDFDKVIEVNLKGAFNCTKLAIAAMSKKRYGKIINIASVVGLTGNVGQANYAASKAGLIGFSKSVAKEYAKRGITVNAIAPGFIETDMTKDLPEDIKSAMLAGIPANKLGQADDIAKAAAFLASDAAGYITGQTLNVDGGMVMNG